MINFTFSKCISRISIIAIIFFFISPECFPQDNIPSFLKNADWLPSKDMKKWEKLVNQIPEADKLLKESNDCYLKIGAIENDASIDDSKKEKQTKKIEEQAINSYNQSLKKFREIYTGLYTYLENNIDDAEKKHPAYNDMIYYNNMATGIYKDYNNLETDNDREQVSQANEYELNAIEKGVAIFTVDQNQYNSDNANKGDEPVVPGDIQINAELYKKYKEYTNNNELPDPVVVSQLMQLQGDDASFETFKEMWNKYLSEEGEKQLQQQQIAEAVAQSDSTDNTIDSNLYANAISSENNANTGTTETPQTTGSNTSTKTNNAKTTQNQTVTNTTNEITKGKSTNIIPPDLFSTSIPENGNVPEYRVQIAASHTPLNLYQITSIYSGPLTVTEVKDDNLYKYQIRAFDLYTDAQKVCSQTKIDNAYLAAYNGATQLKLSSAVKQTKSLEDKVKKYGKDRIVHEIEFAVQIAASRVRLTSAQAAQLNSTQYSLTVQFEDGWYKYQILTGKNLQDALSCLENCGTDKAFLVAYKNGRKLILYKALHEYKTYAP